MDDAALPKDLPAPVRDALAPPASLPERADLLGERRQSVGVAAAAARLGVSAHTLRYYERAGLVAVPRDPAGRRRYDAAAMRRLLFLVRMRASGMPIADLRRYVGLVEAGTSTVAERAALLRAHREDLARRIEELRIALAVTDYKIATYEEGPQT